MCECVGVREREEFKDDFNLFVYLFKILFVCISGVILPEHEVWQSLDTFSWSRQDKRSHDPLTTGEVASGVAEDEHTRPTSSSLVDVLPVLSHDLSLKSAAGFPTYSNFHRDFQDILDYIFIPTGDGIDVQSVAPFPSYEVLTEHVALPTATFPSDHLSVVVDIKVNRLIP